jgi:SNF2 family DNA or RNA helicase
MRQLQAVLKAMMLRRMKDSKIDGKPILTLPPKTENSEYVVFSDDERQFYQDLESKSQVQFNKYLRAGTVGKNYSSILVLLLRLRQACCHPHLTDFEAADAPVSDADAIALAKELSDPVVRRIKAVEAFECPICYDGVEDPVLVIPCGHDTCTECFASLTEKIVQDNIRLGDENGAAKCPVCRGPVEPTKVITLTTFRKVHAPEALGPEHVADDEPADVSDSTYSSSDGGIESDADALGNLAGFVVPDDEFEDSGSGSGSSGSSGAKVDADLDAELDAELFKISKDEPSQNPKKRSKAKKERKPKVRAEEVTPNMLQQLRLEADRNKEARRRYMHFLRDNWEDSAKVSQVVDLLEQIQETDEKTIVFSQWTALLDLIECQLRYKLRLPHCRYTGKMSRNQRDVAVHEFLENPRIKVMLVSLRAGNAGLNLTVASRIIICDPFWNPFIEMQAVDRAHRIGQQREVKVHRILVKETIEDRILALQENKRKLVEAALDEGQSRSLARLSERELAYLFGVDPAGR